MREKDRIACIEMLNWFKLDGRPAGELATDGQIEIFFNLVWRLDKRVEILCSTQYGKSLFVALACIIIACCQHEKIAIVAPTNEKARIIMRYFIEHLGDHEKFSTELEKNTKLERLRMEESKERIMLKNGGGIFVISVQAGNTKKGMEAAMGAGAAICIQDESCLIPDQIESTVFRMIAGKGPEAFYCKIGNPFYRNHFYTSAKDPAYHQVFIDYNRGLAEGRYTPEFIEEARKKPLFDILYECKFPGEGMMDASSFINLFQESRISIRPRLEDKILFVGRRIVSIDPSGEGDDEAVILIRDRFQAAVVHTIKSTNPREIAQFALTFITDYEVKPTDVVIDGFGIGATIGQEIAVATKGKVDVYTVLVGSHPIDEERLNPRRFQRFAEEIDNDGDDLLLNLRATGYFRARNWINRGGILIDTNEKDSQLKAELLTVKYKRSLQGNKLQLMSKVDQLKLGIRSQNRADALALSFLLEENEATGQSAEEREVSYAQARESERIDDPYAVL